MRRHYLLITVILTLAISQAFGATTLPEMNISTPTTWYKAGNPYTATGIITVDSGATLTIEAGVDIQFDGQPEGANTGIVVVRGAYLFANGMPGDTIYLRGNGLMRNGFVVAKDYIRLEYCRFENMNGNTESGGGGALLLEAKDSCEVNHCMFWHNTSPLRNGGAVGVSILSWTVEYVHATIKNCYFFGNHVNNLGSGGAIFLGSNSITDIIGCTFDSNYVEGWGDGGAICIFSPEDGSISDNIFKSNYAYYGGAISRINITPGSFFIKGNLFFRNHGVVGGAANLDIPTTIINNTMVENYADTAGAISIPLWLHVIANNNIIWNNTAPIYPQASNYFESISTFSCIEGYSDLARSVIDADPLFAYPLNHDYHLTANSPCINTGDPASPMDPDYTRADMGAYYFQLSNGSGDVNNNCGINGLDVVYLVGFFKGRITAPPILWKADTDGNCNIDGLDVSYLVNYFKGKNRGPFRNTSCTWNPPPPPDQCGW